MIDLRPEHLKKIKRILAGNVPECEVLCYGSRANGTAKKFSYLDLAVMPPQPLTPTRLEKLSAAFSGAGFPFRVETVDWAVTGKEYRREIKKTGQVIQKPSRKALKSKGA
ncbi:MAG: nucleotidyltransferase domain-containing protein [Elusimicrobiales bacterium]|jgi:predicted nucleotidyltransferase